MTRKEAVRTEWIRRVAEHADAASWGKAAEKLRGLAPYRAAETVFATPAKSLHQSRINCLVDGKNLLMPAPSLREGFFLLAARGIPFKSLSLAVTYKGLEKYGQPVRDETISRFPAGLLLTDSLAVDHEGGRIGDGHGFFDLCGAILYELGGLRQDAAAWTFIREEHISPDPLPQDAWDIRMAGAISPARIIEFAPRPQKPQIFWDALSRDRIKRINPLWKMYDAGLKARDAR